jgi:hypothetical protein
VVLVCLRAGDDRGEDDDRAVDVSTEPLALRLASG